MIQVDHFLNDFFEKCPDLPLLFDTDAPVTVDASLAAELLLL